MTKGIIEFLSMVIEVTKEAAREGKQVNPGVIFKGMYELTKEEAADLGIICAVLSAFMAAHEAKQRVFGGKN